MFYQFIIDKAALEQLRVIPKEVRRNGYRLELLQNSLQGDVKKLEGDERCYRLRVGDHRVLFRQLHQWLDETLRPWFQGRILPVNEPIAERWGVLAGQCQLKGRPLEVVDGFIAATALEHDLAGSAILRTLCCSS